MNLKKIIGTVVIVGIIAIGSVYFMTSKSAYVSTKHVNTLSKSNITDASSKEINSNLNKDTQTQNISSKTNSNQNSSVSTSNNNTSNNQTNNSNSVSSKQVADKTITPIINDGTGNFEDIVTGANYMTGIIGNTQIMIPLKGGHIVNNLLVLPEYYVNKLNETFTAKIASLGNNNFKIYEYYNGKNTAIFNLKYHANKWTPTLAGTCTCVASNQLSAITFDIINPDVAPPLMQMPFYHTVINGTVVTIISKDKSINGYYEKYAGDSNLFNLQIDCDYNNSGYGDKKYQNKLIESYNGQETGEYLINQIANTGNSIGVYKTKPETGQSKTFNVTLTGSLNPQ